MRRMIQGSAALARDDAQASRPGHLMGDSFAPAIGIVIAGCASLFLWVALLLLARWVAYALL